MKNSISQEQFQAIKMRLETMKFQKIVIVSGSMEPLIMTGEHLIVVPLTRPPEKFDILVFWQQNMLICHFVWSVNRFSWSGEDPLIVTRNLIGRGEDFPFAKSQVLGIVLGKKISLRIKLKFVFKKLLSRR